MQAPSLLPAPAGRALLHRIWLRLAEQMPLPTTRNRAHYDAAKFCLREVDMLYKTGFPSLEKQSAALLRLERAEQPCARYHLVDVPGMAVQALAFPTC